MEKIKIYLEINDYKINDIGTLNNKVIKMKEKDSFLEYDLKNNILTRENNEMKQTIDFKTKKFSYFLKQYSSEISQDFTILSLTNHDKQVNIIYRIENSTFHLNLKYKKIQQ